MAFIETPAVEGISSSRIRVARGDYSFAVDGGAVSTIPLIGATAIPSGAIIFGGFIEVTTQLTSGGSATIAVQVNAANDIITAVAVASWTVGVKNILPTMTTGALTASTAVKTTAARDISAVIGTAALTAGVFKVVLFYIDPQTP